MTRRELWGVLGGGYLAIDVQGADAAGSIVELRRYQLRNTSDNMVSRMTDQLGKNLLPALTRAGVQRVGAFSMNIGEGSPSVLLVTEHASVAAWEASVGKVTSDEDYNKASEAWFGGPIPYLTMDVTLLRSFKSVPKVEPGTPLEGGKQRIFELRTYESATTRTLARKVKMFDEGEVALFRKIGITPVFFGETISGRRMPNLTYMVSFEDLAAREKAWAAFGNHPEWVKMRSMPIYSDPELVSSTSIGILRPLPFSQIR